LPHVALRSNAQQALAPQKLIEGDNKFNGLLIAAALVFLALCFVIGYSHNIRLPWTKAGAPATAAPAQPDPSAAPASDAAPSSSSQSITPPATDLASQPPLPDSASVAPSSKFEAPALPANPAAPTPAYFPVTAPAEGNAPRMIELPEKTVFDSPKVLIQLRQYFFVPPQAGPEWSHKLDQILIGEPLLKMPPAPASEADPSVVRLRATFGIDGAVKDVRPINGPVALIPRSVEAVRQWRYQPSLLDGAPLEWQGDFTIEFRPAS
jgi:cytoskeletal protein RodZ